MAAALRAISSHAFRAISQRPASLCRVSQAVLPRWQNPPRLSGPNRSIEFNRRAFTTESLPKPLFRCTLIEPVVPPDSRFFVDPEELEGAVNAYFEEHLALYRNRCPQAIQSGAPQQEKMYRKLAEMVGRFLLALDRQPPSNETLLTEIPVELEWLLNNLPEYKYLNGKEYQKDCRFISYAVFDALARRGSAYAFPLMYLRDEVPLLKKKFFEGDLLTRSEIVPRLEEAWRGLMPSFLNAPHSLQTQDYFRLAELTCHELLTQIERGAVQEAFVEAEIDRILGELIEKHSASYLNNDATQSPDFSHGVKERLHYIV